MTEISQNLDPALIDRFAAIVGDKYALRDEQDIAPYLIERRGLWHGATSLVLRPGSVDEVSRIMRLATETGTPIVPQSGNTGLVGAQVPDQSGREIILSQAPRGGDRPRSRLLGQRHHLCLAADAAGGDQAQGPRPRGRVRGAVDRYIPDRARRDGVLAYGNARELCLGVEVVLPTGEVFDDLRKLKKDNTGYDLKQPLHRRRGHARHHHQGRAEAAGPRPRTSRPSWIAVPSTRRPHIEPARAAHARAGDDNVGSCELIGQSTASIWCCSHSGQRAGSARPMTSHWYVLAEWSSSRPLARPTDRAVWKRWKRVSAMVSSKASVLDAVIARRARRRRDAFWTFRENATPNARSAEGAVDQARHLGVDRNDPDASSTRGWRAWSRRSVPGCRRGLLRPYRRRQPPLSTSRGAVDRRRRGVSRACYHRHQHGGARRRACPCTARSRPSTASAS